MTNKRPLALYSGTREQIQPGDWIDPAVVPWPPRYIVGCGLSWNSTTGITVAPGSCVDSTNTAGMTLTSASSISTGTAAALGGIDQQALAGTAATINATKTIVGTGTNFLTGFNPIAMSGTATVVGGTVTGTGTKFLSQITVNDLIGNSSAGYSSVASIASDTSLTITLTGTTIALTSASINRIEQPFIQCGAQPCTRIYNINSDTSLLLQSSSTATTSGLTMTAGGLETSNIGNVNSFYHVFVCVQSGTAGVILSSQRTTPYMTLSSFRRIGSVMADANGNLTPFSQYGENNLRTYRHEFANNTNQCRIAIAQNPTSWTTYQGSQAAPPTATALTLTVFESAASSSWAVRPANLPTGAATTYGTLWFGGASTGMAGWMPCKCDGAQQVQAIHNVSGGTLYVDVGGWEDAL